MMKEFKEKAKLKNADEFNFKMYSSKIDVS